MVSAPVDAVDSIAGGAAAQLRSERERVKLALQRVHEALFDPQHGDFGFPIQERAAVAYFVALLHRDELVARFYLDLARQCDIDGSLMCALEALATDSTTNGPYGEYSLSTPLRRESQPGLHFALETGSPVGTRMAHAIEHAHRVLFHPRDGRQEHLEVLARVGWEDEQIVLLTQVVSVVTFHIRVAIGARSLALQSQLQRCAGRTAVVTRVEAGAVAGTRKGNDREALRVAASDVDAGPAGVHPRVFTTRPVAWQPWLAPATTHLDRAFDWVGSFGKRRAYSPSFRLSARDPYVSLPLAEIEDDIFGDHAEGLGRAERELGALIASRLNGCAYCASIHSRTTIKFSGREREVLDVLRDGVGVQLGGEWDIYADTAVTLSETPVAFTQNDAAHLLAVTGAPATALDFIHSVAYFNFSNRILLTLGTAVVS